jgi:hypothetical protein
MTVAWRHSTNHAYLKADCRHFGWQVYHNNFPQLKSHRYGLCKLSMHISLKIPGSPSALASVTYHEDDEQIAQGLDFCANAFARLSELRVSSCVLTLEQIELVVFTIARHLELKFEEPAVGLETCRGHDKSSAPHTSRGRECSAEDGLISDDQLCKT